MVMLEINIYIKNPNITIHLNATVLINAGF